jgi:hypothetical protein
MKNKRINDFSSVRNFEKEIKNTYLLIKALIAHIFGLREFLEFTRAKEKPDWDSFKKFFNINSKQINQLYEMGFIFLFANFESFSFNLTKELFKKYPSFFTSEKIVKFEELKDFKTIKEIRDYFIDCSAIQKSYDTSAWLDFLKRNFKITLFRTKKELELFEALNSLRNIFLHSSSKTNSKFRNEMRKILKTPVPLNKKVKLSREKCLNVLYSALKKIISNLR